MDNIFKVSVIIPVYNAAEFLRQGLDSLLNQTLRAIEIICVNDGSSDKSLEILKEYEKKDSRVKVIDQENQGAGAARNNGMAIAQGEYLSFLDADDFFEKNMLEESYNAACAKNAKPFAATDEDVRDNIFRMFNGWPWDKLYKREYIDRIGIEYQNLRTTNDMFFVFIALARAKKIVTVDKILIHQRVNVKTSLSRTREKSWDCFYIALLAMQKELKDRRLYDRMEKAFVNWALNFSLWQLNTMTGDAYEKTYKLLKKEGFERLDITRHDRNYFYSKKEYNQFLQVFTTSFEKNKNN